MSRRRSSGQVAHNPPRELADRRATAVDLEGLNARQIKYRTCVSCSTTYRTVKDADACEALAGQDQ